jgi:hypothetical protein
MVTPVKPPSANALTGTTVTWEGSEIGPSILHRQKHSSPRFASGFCRLTPESELQPAQARAPMARRRGERVRVVRAVHSLAKGTRPP